MDGNAAREENADGSTGDRDRGGTIVGRGVTRTLLLRVDYMRVNGENKE